MKQSGTLWHMLGPFRQSPRRLPQEIRTVQGRCLCNMKQPGMESTNCTGSCEVCLYACSTEMHPQVGTQLLFTRNQSDRAEKGHDRARAPQILPTSGRLSLSLKRNELPNHRMIADDHCQVTKHCRKRAPSREGFRLQWLRTNALNLSFGLSLRKACAKAALVLGNWAWH